MNPASAPARRPRWRTVFDRLLRAAGALTLLFLGLCLTRAPMPLYDALAVDPAARVHARADVVVVLGGGGIPSESGLLRCYHGAEAALGHPDARVIISLPADGDPEHSSVGRMRDELVLRGVERARIQLEHDARSTHEQAVAIAALLSGQPRARVLVVTSEYHLRRSLLAFRRAGLDAAAGPAGVRAAEADLGGFTAWRYRFWHNLTNSVVAVREWLALLAYRLRGWA